MASKLPKLLFVDTNIFLDFYRGRNDAALSLLEHLDTIQDRIIVTYQVEMEFKKNRQSAILEGDKDLKNISFKINRPGLFSDAAAIRSAEKKLEAVETSIKAIRKRLAKALAKPTTDDPVYKVCQRIFNKNDDLNLTREHDKKGYIRRKAMRRFLLGCPPRKKNDTSIGDAINWEWMIYCAVAKKAELVIVSRDSDFGIEYDNKTYLNDHLHQEFSDRVSKKRKILLYQKLSQALKHFEISVSPEEEQAEQEILAMFDDISHEPIAGTEQNFPKTEV
jgi:predicted nucleic acid-binding protein